MGLRAKVMLWVLLLFLAIGGLSLWLLRGSVEQGYLQLEDQIAVDDFNRVLRSLDDEMLVLDRVLREWSYWEDLYRDAARPDPRFAARNLGAEAVAASELAWVGIRRPGSAGLLSLHAPPDLALGLPDSLDEGVRTALDQGRLANARAALPCGVARAGAKGLLMLCQRPLLGSPQRQPEEARGTVAVAGHLGDRVAAEVAQRSGLLLSIRPIEPTESLPGEAVAQELRSLTGAGPLRIAADGGQLRMYWPVRDIRGVPVAVIEVSWPRRLMVRSEELLDQVRWLVLGLAAALAIGIVLLVDRAVVARLVRLRRELAAVRGQRAWTQRVHASGHDEISGLSEGVNHLLGVIASQVQTLEQLSQTDALTGLVNRRRFTDQLDLALRAAQRSGEPLSLLLADADFFKPYNDRYGHLQGDQALQAIAASLSEASRRPSDLVARLGGEEFAMLLPNTDLAGAEHCAAQVQAALRARAVPHEAGGPARQLTLSLGVAQAQPGESASSFYHRADLALYRAKSAGRDRISR